MAADVNGWSLRSQLWLQFRHSHTSVNVGMNRVVIYTGPMCPFCTRAKRLLDERGVSYEEIDVSADPEQLRRMMEASGRRTIPQIFLDGKAIGGYEELALLDRQGGLGELIGD